MAFKRTIDRKGLSLPGLIDIIFLLLIFSLVTLSVSQTRIEEKSKGDQNVDFELPEFRARVTEESDKHVLTLIFQVEYKEHKNPNSPRVVYILRPSKSGMITIDEAKQAALNDSVFAEFPENFLSLSDAAFQRLDASRLIRRSLDEYKKENFFKPDLSNSVEIRAVKDMEFRIFNYILELCSTYGDTIPQVNIHALGGREVVSEF
ncbi:MAG TPA: hypothetical protein ENN03_11910 [bacterium]|nr:hypothetical protein [bacterium]